MSTFKQAQSAYDNLLPPEDEPDDEDTCDFWEDWYDDEDTCDFWEDWYDDIE